jgi:predicted regulator of Ras-like GTPase activity (Roadblock/LC7/MglB family)
MAANLPQLLEEDVSGLNSALHDLLCKSEASAAMLIDKGGFLITTTGLVDGFDTVTLSALAAASFAATQGLAVLIGETNFSTVYQQGENNSLLVVNVDPSCLLTVVFRAAIAVGAVKYYAEQSISTIQRHLVTARERDPSTTIDLSLINLADTRPVFRKKAKNRAG